MKNTKRLMLTILLLGVIPLSGCSTGATGESVVGMPGSAFWFKTASQPTIIAYFKRSCLSYGYKDGTPNMAQCLQAEIGDARQRASDRMKNATTYKAPTMRTISCYNYGTITQCNSW